MRASRHYGKKQRRIKHGRRAQKSRVETVIIKPAGIIGTPLEDLDPPLLFCGRSPQQQMQCSMQTCRLVAKNAARFGPQLHPTLKRFFFRQTDNCGSCIPPSHPITESRWPAKRPRAARRASQTGRAEPRVTPPVRSGSAARAAAPGAAAAAPGPPPRRCTSRAPPAAAAPARWRAAQRRARPRRQSPRRGRAWTARGAGRRGWTRRSRRRRR